MSRVQQQFNIVLDIAKMQQAVAIRRLVRFGTIMGIALAGQVLVTISLGTLPWVQQHVFIMVIVEILWWPPFLCVLYFSFNGVVRLIKLAIRSHQLLYQQIADMHKYYEYQMEEKDRYLYRLSRSMRGKMRIVRLEPLNASKQRAIPEDLSH